MSRVFNVKMSCKALTDIRHRDDIAREIPAPMESFNSLPIKIHRVSGDGGNLAFCGVVGRARHDILSPFAMLE